MSKLRWLILLLLGTVFVTRGSAQSVIHDVIYEKQGGAAFTMDVFKPAKPNHAAVVWIVSGGWFSKHEDINPQLAGYINAQGFTVFEVVHGSQPKYVIPEIVAMLTHAIRFIHANAETYGIDPDRIGVAGASAGGHLSLMLAGLGDSGDPTAKDPIDRASSKIKAVVAYFPPTDFLNWGGIGQLPFKRQELAVYMPAFGITAETPEQKLLDLGRSLSPIYKVSSSYPPTLLIHGDKDPLVPMQQSQEMDSALGKAGVKHKLIIIPGGAHDAVTVAGGAMEFMKWFQENL